MNQARIGSGRNGSIGVPSSSPKGLACVLLLAFAVGAHAEPVSTGTDAAAVGRIRVRGSVELGGPSSALRVRSGALPYFTGDRIAVGPEGSATLTLRGGAVTLGANAVGSIEPAASGARLHLERGVAVMHFDPTVSFEAVAGAVRVRPAASREGPNPIEALVHVEEGVEVAVASRAGELVIERGGAEEPQRLVAGETLRIALSPQALPPVAAEPVEESTLEEQIATWAAGGLGVGLVGWGTYEIIDDDESDGSPSTN